MVKDGTKSVHPRNLSERVVSSYGKVKNGNSIHAYSSKGRRQIRGDVKISSLEPQTFYKMLQNYLRGSVTQTVIFADLSQNWLGPLPIQIVIYQIVQMAFCDLSHTFHKQVTNVSQHVFVILLWEILMSPLTMAAASIFSCPYSYAAKAIYLYWLLQHFACCQCLRSLKCLLKHLKKSLSITFI